MHAGPLFPDWPFQGLDSHAFGLIMADCPWDFSLFSEKGGNKSAQKHYRCLPLQTIAAFPVADLAAPDCLLWMWATSPMIDQQLWVMQQWGFEFKTMGFWNKITKNGKQHFGTGYVLRGNAEPYLIGARGQPRTTKSVRSAFDGVVREHSRKPEQAYINAERLLPKVRRVELFSRTNRKGWESWGDEVGKFDAEVSKSIEQKPVSKIGEAPLFGVSAITLA